MKQIAERGSLELLHHIGDERTPETFLVRLTEQPKIAGSLEAARDWNELGDYRLNGSQVQTVKLWNEEFL